MGQQEYMEMRGSIVKIIPITPELVEQRSGGTLTYSELAAILEEYGLDIAHVITDPSRQYEHTFYADFEHGFYGYIDSLEADYLTGTGKGALALRRLSARFEGGNACLIRRNWENYYKWTVPVPLLIHDFQRRVRDIEPDRVFAVWYDIYKRIDYSNGTWEADTLDYVFSKAPAPVLPELNDNGMVTVYRGMGELSQPPDQAISWSTNANSALWFANHSGRGTHMVVAEVEPVDIIAYFPTFQTENEVIVRPGTPRNIRYEDMIVANQENFTRLTGRILLEAHYFGVQAVKLGYVEESGFLSMHGLKHILRVLILALVYMENSGDALSQNDKAVMVYFSLLHDIGRTTEDTDESHGDASVEVIRKRNLRIKGLQMKKKDYEIARLIIQNHCRPDEVGIQAIMEQPNFSRKDKERAVHLYLICKDVDGLDRVRFNGLDYRQLRTDFARRLPLFAGCLLKERVMDLADRKLFMERFNTGKTVTEASCNGQSQAAAHFRAHQSETPTGL